MNEAKTSQDKASVIGAAKAMPMTGWAINTLAVLAVLGMLYLASSLLLPLVLSMLLALLLSPVVTLLSNWGLPRPAGSLLVILTLGASIVGGTYMLAAPASDWVEQVPGAINSLRIELAPITDKLEGVSEAAKSVEKISDGDGEGQAPRKLVQVEGKKLRDAFLKKLQTFLLGSVVLFFFLYFLLAGAERLQRNTSAPCPTSPASAACRLSCVACSARFHGIC